MDWIIDFEQRHREYDLINSTYSSLVNSYIENQRIKKRKKGCFISYSFYLLLKV